MPFFFLDNLEKRILENSTLKPYVWWRYIDDVFLIWKHGEEALKVFLEQLNKYLSSKYKIYK